MEITMKNFWHQLPGILWTIARSEFVTLDLEMTGISDSVWDPENDKDGQPSREAMYRNGKRIASTFNVFELGLTCVQAQEGGCSRPTIANLVNRFLSDGSYCTKSYSFYVNPLLLEETREDSAFAKGVDRKLTTSLQTLKFMKKEGLRLEKMFDDPVPHLSRKEQKEAFFRFLNRMKKQVVEDHRYDKDEDFDVFRGYVESEIAAWLSCCKEDRPSEIKIYIPLSDSKKRNRVYVDIVRVAAQHMLPPWMKCRVWDHGATVRIYREDTAEETEALAGGDFADYVDPSYIIDAMSSHYGSLAVQDFSNQVKAKIGQIFPERCQRNDKDTAESAEDQVYNALKTLEFHFKLHRPVIVGHNIFWDLLFLYQTFFKDLPDTSVEFFAKIHDSFPCILDTKVMAIRTQAVEGEDPLGDIFERLNSSNARPHIAWRTGYGFGRASNPHEAGYDSFMTANVLLRLGHKLARESRNEGASEHESWRKRMRKLYSKGWLIDIERDPTCFDSGSESDAGFGEETDSDSGEDVVGSLHWKHPVVEDFHNIIRVGRYTNVDVRKQWEIYQAVGSRRST
ncbi:caf1 family ribonuclease [Colletotrichum plurivorum]|uniref:Caf1 family ribonuclease n=1 Tax=Colletotrichum plurivorum TaxID=2175906 RepID=A0A8H6NN45_9PEZI|nr:caf1 family ribonuclease [Colletotrichum plurivorum]